MKRKSKASKRSKTTKAKPPAKEPAKAPAKAPAKTKPASGKMLTLFRPDGAGGKVPLLELAIPKQCLDLSWRIQNRDDKATVIGEQPVTVSEFCRIPKLPMTKLLHHLSEQDHANLIALIDGQWKRKEYTNKADYSRFKDAQGAAVYRAAPPESVAAPHELMVAVEVEAALSERVEDALWALALRVAKHCGSADLLQNQPRTIARFVRFAADGVLAQMGGK